MSEVWVTESPQADVPSKGILGLLGRDTLERANHPRGPDSRQPVQNRRLITIVMQPNTPQDPHTSSGNMQIFPSPLPSQPS